MKDSKTKVEESTRLTYTWVTKDLLWFIMNKKTRVKEKTYMSIGVMKD